MSDFIKKGTNEEDMRGGVQDHPNTHHIHCCHDGNCPNMCREDHQVPSNNEHEGKNEHVEPGEVLLNEEKGEHAGAYPGMVRKFR